MGGDICLAVPREKMFLSGRIFFYISDLFVARNRFLKREFFNRLVGLPLYYTGQFLLAFSADVLNNLYHDF